MLLSEETVNLKAGAADKVRLYGWKFRDAPGRFEMIGKGLLDVDPEYQRTGSVSNDKVLRIASKWSWLACGALIVAERPDGRLFVVEGQHRLLAARKRSDITQLPCLIFRVESVEREAEGFLQANTERRPVNACDKYRARLRAGDELALRLQSIFDASGYRVVSGHGEGKSVRCVGLCLSLLEQDGELFQDLWPLVVLAHEEGTIHERVLAGLFYLAQKTDRQIMREPFRTRIANAGRAAFIDAANKASAFYAKGGPRVWGVGIAGMLNKGARTNKIELAAETD